MSRLLIIIFGVLSICSLTLGDQKQQVTYQIKFSDLVYEVNYNLSRDGRYILVAPTTSASYDFISVHDLVSRKEICRYNYISVLGDSLQFSPDGSKFAIIEWDSSAREYQLELYETKSCKRLSILERRSYLEHPQNTDVQFSEDSTVLFVNWAGTFQLFEIRSSKLLSSFWGFAGAISPDGKSVVIEDYQVLNVFDVNGSLLSQIKSDGYNYDFAQFSKDSSKLFYQKKSFKDKKIRLYSFDLKNSAERVLISELEDHYSYGLSLNSPFYVISNKDSGAHVFNFEAGTSYWTTPQIGYLSDNSFNYDGTLLIARVEEGYLQPTNIAVVENLLTQKTMVSIKESSPITSISFSPRSNQIIYVLKKEGVLKVLDL